ncbi:ATP-binding cassette, sub-family B, member 1, partial [Operophtera brumata]
MVLRRIKDEEELREDSVRKDDNPEETVPSIPYLTLLARCWHPLMRPVYTPSLTDPIPFTSLSSNYAMVAGGLVLAFGTNVGLALESGIRNSGFVAGVTLPYSITLVAGTFQNMISYTKSEKQGVPDDKAFLSKIHLFGVKYSCVHRIRQAYFRAALNQDFAYYDLRQTGGFASRMADALAQEVLGSIRTVYACNGQQKELERYTIPLAEARKINIKKAHVLLFSGHSVV